MGELFGSKGAMVINVAYLLVGLATFLIARMLLQEGESLAAAEKLAEGGERKTSNPLVKFTRPVFVQYIVPIVRSRSFWDEKRKYYKRKLTSAGLEEELTPDEFIAFKLLLIGMFPLVAGFLNATDLVAVSWWIITGSGIAGWFYPDFWMSQRIKARQKLILRSLPFIVDLLALSTEAGLDFVGAIGKVVEKATPGPLVDEFGQLLKQIRVGSSRQEALREMALRVDMPEFSSFVTILISADQMGASIGKILRQQSDQIRTERMVRAEKAGALAASRVMIPVVLFIVPAVLLMVFGPFVVRLFYPEA